MTVAGLSAGWWLGELLRRYVARTVDLYRWDRQLATRTCPAESPQFGIPCELALHHAGPHEGEGMRWQLAVSR